MVRVRTGRLQLNIHVRQLGLYDLEVTDPLIELLSIIHIGHGNIQGILHNTKGAS